MGGETAVFVASTDRTLCDHLSDAAGLRVIGSTADGRLARSAITSGMATLYVLDARVMGPCHDLLALARTVPGAVLITPSGAPPDGWSASGRERRWCPEPYDPLEIVAWAQWFAETEREGPVNVFVTMEASSGGRESVEPRRSAPEVQRPVPGGSRAELAALRGRPMPSYGNPSPASAGVVAVASPKGGVGKTTVAVNLAVAAAMRGEDVVLLDLDRFSADAGLYLGLDNGLTLLDVVPRLEALGRDRADRELARHPSGLHVVRGPARPDLAQYVVPDDVARLIVWARQNFRRVFVDTPCAVSDEALREVLEWVDAVLAVTTLDAAALRQTAFFLQSLREGSLPPHGDVRLIVNRASPASPVSLGGLPKFFGVGPAAVIPDEPRACEAAAFDGEPVVWRGTPATLAGAYLRLDRLLGGVPEPEPRRRWRLAWPRRPLR